MKLFEKISGKI